MHGHRIDSFLIADNVRLEIVHESNPYYAGENVSLVVRLRHLGSAEKHASFKEKIDELHKDIEKRIDSSSSIVNDNDENSKGPWSMGSLFNVLKRDNTNEEDIEAQREHERYTEYVTKQLQYHKPVELMAGFVQVLGLFQYSPDPIDDSSFDTSSNKLMYLNQSTRPEAEQNNGTGPNANHHVGLSSDAINGQQTDVTESHVNLRKYFQSSFKFGPRDPEAMFDSSEIPVFDVKDYFEEFVNLPFLIIPQSLLFPELTLQPGEVKSFHFKSEKLPNDVCPSYNNSENFAVNYYVEFGVNRVESNAIKPLFIKTPIYVSPLVTNNGYQYTSELGTKTCIMKPAHIREVLQSQGMKRKFSTDTSSTFARRKSSVSLPNDRSSMDIDALKKSFVDIIKKTTVEEDIEELIETQLNIQFGKEDETSPAPDITNTEGDQNEEESRIVFNHNTNSTKKNISILKRTANELMIMTSEPSSNSSDSLKPQLVNGQNNYIINRNGQRIATASFSKVFYTTTDDIDLNIHLADNADFTVSGVNATLQLMEMINGSFLTDTAKDMAKKPNIRTVTTSHAVSFDETSDISFKLTIPKTPMHLMPSQFMSNVFQVKWSVLIRFILISKDGSPTMQEFYEDKKGVLYHSLDTIDGEEFDCTIPVILLPTDSDLAGW